MSTQVCRWYVPVDGHPHFIGSGRAIHVAARQHGVVEVWTIESEDTLAAGERAITANFAEAYGTGQLMGPEVLHHIGSTFDAVTTSLVWHLFQVKRPAEASS